MSRESSRIGCRAAIVSTFHSHARTRAHGSELVGREGVVVAVLRNGTTALVKLDNDPYGLPGGVRCWPLQWDDLDVKAPVVMASPPAYVTGVTTAGGSIELHAVEPGTTVAVCSMPALPLPICGWSVTFSPNVSRACPTCVALISGS